MAEVSIKKASLITAISKYSTVFITIFFSAILARILTPGDYGIVAIVGVFTTFFGVFSKMGLGTAVIQRKDLTDTEINDIYTFSFYIALFFSSVFVLLAFPISLFFKNNVYISICLILSISVFFNILNMIPEAILLREKKFLLVGIRRIIVSIITFCFTIILALLEFKYYALVIQSVLAAFFTFIWNKKNAHVSFRLKFNLIPIKKIANYSGFEFGFNLINYFARNSDKILMGKFLGVLPLGQYDRAYKIMLYPVQNLTHVITPTLHPILSDHQDDKEYIYNKYIKIIELLSTAGVLVTAVCFWCSREIILLAFGAQWFDASVAFKWLSLSIWSQMVSASTGAIFLSIGDSRLMFIAGTAATILITSSTITGILISGGNIGIVSIFISLAYSFSFFIDYFVLIKKGFKKKFTGFILLFKYDILVFLICMFTGYLLDSYLTIEHLFLSFLIKSSLIGLPFLFFIIIKYRKELRNKIFHKK